MKRAWWLQSCLPIRSPSKICSASWCAAIRNSSSIGSWPGQKTDRGPMSFSFWPLFGSAPSQRSEHHRRVHPGMSGGLQLPASPACCTDARASPFQSRHLAADGPNSFSPSGTSSEKRTPRRDSLIGRTGEFYFGAFGENSGGIDTRAACANATSRPLTSLTASSLNSRLNFLLCIPTLQFR